MPDPEPDELNSRHSLRQRAPSSSFYHEWRKETES
jgi:hypothetical protein